MAVARRQDGAGERRPVTRRRSTTDSVSGPEDSDSASTAPQLRSRRRASSAPARNTTVERRTAGAKSHTAPSEPETTSNTTSNTEAEELEGLSDEEIEEYTSTRAKKSRRTRTPASGVVEPPPPDDNYGLHTMDGKPLPQPADTGPEDPFAGDEEDEELAPVQAKYRRNLDSREIYRGRTRLALIRDLAMGEWSDSAIAQSIGVPLDIVTDFRQTYEHEIQEVSSALAGQLAIESAGMWISKRQNRIAELQEDFEDIDLVLAVMRENTKIMLHNGIDGSDSQMRGDAFDTNLLLGSRRHQNLLRSKIAILKAVADELAPRNRDDSAEDNTNTIRYVIEQDGTGDDIIGSLT